MANNASERGRGEVDNTNEGGRGLALYANERGIGDVDDANERGRDVDNANERETDELPMSRERE